MIPEPDQGKRFNSSRESIRNSNGCGIRTGHTNTHPTVYTSNAIKERSDKLSLGNQQLIKTDEEV